MIGKKRVHKAKNPARCLQGAGFQCYKFVIYLSDRYCVSLNVLIFLTLVHFMDIKRTLYRYGGPLRCGMPSVKSVSIVPAARRIEKNAFRFRL